ncbi:hypothetical protein D9758_007053 [Tetrapyrgos nigripes]|uniref:Uncharacterized protein n=1 Tax=Tetrapyrgos nigripes TaxID=182062 RepID=A0A8H5GDT7_9AGAR|nr:hypothetical protein D9758_007053 [Tetrapyrgos nigripes]
MMCLKLRQASSHIPFILVLAFSQDVRCGYQTFRSSERIRRALGPSVTKYVIDPSDFRHRFENGLYDNLMEDEAAILYKRIQNHDVQMGNLPLRLWTTVAESCALILETKRRGFSA